MIKYKNNNNLLLAKALELSIIVQQVLVCKPGNTSNYNNNNNSNNNNNNNSNNSIKPLFNLSLPYIIQLFSKVV